MARWSRYNPPLLAAVVGTVLVSPAASRPSCADPPHFRIEQLATGVWAAESRRQGLTAEWLGLTEMPAQFRDWWFGRFYPDNIQTLLKEADAAK